MYIADLEADLECLKKWLDGIEENLSSQMSRAWSYDELEGVLHEHKVCISSLTAPICSFVVFSVVKFGMLLTKILLN